MPLKENTNLELTSLIWLDNLADATQENREIQDKFRSVINHLKIFDNCQECQDYIRHKINQEYDKIILIVSGRLGQQIIENIHHLKPILTIFVFCMDKERNELWAKKYKKIQDVVVLLEDLLIQIDFVRKSNDHKLNEFIQIFSNKDEIIPLLLHIDYSLIDKKQFLNICFKEYQGNLKETENIKEFEHLYSSSNALNWFFRETFLYRLLIKSLQTFNIDLLFLLRFFLQDIEKQLKLCVPITVPVYRGQLMTNEQIESLKKSIHENSLRFNSFIMASRSRDQVLKSLHNSTNRSNLNPVLFQIEINQIGKQFEEFILFPITTLFQIISIDFLNDVYIVKIAVSNPNQYLNQQSKNAIELGHLLRNLGQLDDAEQIFNRLLSQNPIDNSEFYDGLARVAQDKGLYKTSLDLYEKSLETVSSVKHPHSLNNLGCAYDYLEEYDQALEYYSKALNIMTNDLDQAMCINNIGITLANKEQYKEALQCFQQSLSIREKVLPENHPDLGISYTNIGVLNSSIGQFDDALEYYHKALKIFSKMHSNAFKGVVYQHIAQIFYDKNELDEALKNYQQAANIFRKTRPVNHPNLVYVEQIINQLVTQTK